MNTDYTFKSISISYPELTKILQDEGIIPDNACVECVKHKTDSMELDMSIDWIKENL